MAEVPSTGRIYSRAQEHFAAWSNGQGISGTPSAEDIAQYLQHCVDVRGIGSAGVHLSAIADLFRSAGLGLDTRHEAIQNVMIAARRRRDTRTTASKDRTR